MTTILTDDDCKRLWAEEIDMPNWRINGERFARAVEAAVLAKLAQQEPFGYFRAEPFGWTDCAESDEDAVPLYAAPVAQQADRQRVPEGWGADPSAAAVELAKMVMSDCGLAVEHRHDLLGRIAARIEKFAAAPEAPAQNGHLADDERVAALCTLSYAAGMKAGWNYCASEDNEGFERSQKSVGEAIRILKAHRAAPEAPAQASAVDERAAFEAWWKGDLLDWRGHQNTAALHAWEGWQARAALAQKGGE